MVPTVAILAGGRGTRLAPVTDDTIPKVLVPVCGRPFLDFKLEQLRASGFVDVVLLVGAHADQVVAHVGDGRRFGLHVRYQHDGDHPLGTGGSVLSALPLLPKEFWVTYGDTLLDVEPAAAERHLSGHPSWLALMTVLENADRWEPSNVDVDDGRVVAYAKGDPLGTFRFIDYGMLLFRRAAFAGLRETGAFDLQRVAQSLIDTSSLGAWTVTERFHDIGDPDRLAETETYLQARVSSQQAEGDAPRPAR